MSKQKTGSNEEENNFLFSDALYLKCFAEDHKVWVAGKKTTTWLALEIEARVHQAAVYRVVCRRQVSDRPCERGREMLLESREKAAVRRR